MILLLAFAFVAGLVTILSPCILPILPIILSSSIGDNEKDSKRPFGIVAGFILSFTFFTLFLTGIVKLLGISAYSLRILAVFVIGLFGVSMIVPNFQLFLENLFSRMSAHTPSSQNKKGFLGGVVIGVSLGLLWTPCVGPILASVISLALTGTVTFSALLITLAYSLGTAIPMFVIIIGGKKVIQNSPKLINNTKNIQKWFGVVMVATAIAIYFNVDRKFQEIILNAFPNYGTNLTKFESNNYILEQLNPSEETAKDYGKTTDKLMPNNNPIAPQLIRGGEWFNSEPLSLDELRGKVVIIDFWTYSCINCQRTFPYLKDWWVKYKDDGLVIIGVHSPEFEFEKDKKNVEKALKDFGIIYPVMQDNNFDTWRNYSNRYWPAKYIIDKDGYIRYTHFGEGAYDESEKIIQELLEETGETINVDINNPTYQVSTKTPETYLGFLRTKNFASPEHLLPNKFQTYSFPNKLGYNKYAYNGDVLISGEYSNPKKGTQLNFNFDSKEVYLVMRPKTGSSTVKILVDGERQNFGEDVFDGIVTIDSDRLYKIVKLDKQGEHTLTIEFEDDNTEVFAFTFG